MNYIRSVLQPGETIVVEGRLHWIIYTHAMILGALAAFVPLVFGLFESQDPELPMVAVFSGAAFLILALMAFIRAWFTQWITELAITNRRVIYKTGFISRQTVEMNMDKVETVNVDQSILGRLLNFGTIHIRGTGRGIEHLHQIARPLGLRSAITAK